MGTNDVIFATGFATVRRNDPFLFVARWAAKLRRHIQSGPHGRRHVLRFQSSQERARVSKSVKNRPKISRLCAQPVSSNIATVCDSLSSDLNLTFPYTSIDWTPERGYAENTPLNHVPWRPWGAGSHLGLTIVVNAELNEYYCSSEASHGFKVRIEGKLR